MWDRTPGLRSAQHNLATICERYGGRRSRARGAISLEPGAIEKARAVAAEIVAELSRKPTRKLITCACLMEER